MRNTDATSVNHTTGQMTRYRTIVADPPWEVNRGPEWASNGPSRRLTYPTMPVDAILRMPVRLLADDGCHLYLWTINKFLEETYAIARAWGFAPSTLLTWCKKPRGIGLGGTFTITTEHCLFCRRGKLTSTDRIDRTWWEWKRGEHSEKPDEFMRMVERVSPPPYLELFARNYTPLFPKRTGWDVWGNEVEKDVEMEAV